MDHFLHKNSIVALVNVWPRPKFSKVNLAELSGYGVL